jgi:hypothetical protein
MRLFARLEEDKPAIRAEGGASAVIMLAFTKHVYGKIRLDTHPT